MSKSQKMKEIQTQMKDLQNKFLKLRFDQSDNPNNPVKLWAKVLKKGYYC